MNIKNYLAAAVLIALPISQQVQADFLGALDGRGADLTETADRSVELNTNSTDGLNNSELKSAVAIFVHSLLLYRPDVSIRF